MQRGNFCASALIIHAYISQVQPLPAVKFSYSDARSDLMAMCYSFVRSLGMHNDVLRNDWSFCNSALIFLLMVEDKE